MSNARTLASLIDGSNIVVPSGYGLDFSANANFSGMTSEALDDYEEGTWTPVCQPSSGTQTILGSGVGKYTKIGNIVFLTFGNRTDHGQSLTAGSNTYFLIKNFPFTQFGGTSYDFSNSSLVNFSDPDNSYSLFNLSARSSTGNNNYIVVYNKSSINFTSGDPLQLFHMMITS
jgi:hypothetical protein